MIELELLLIGLLFSDILNVDIIYGFKSFPIF